MTHATILAAAGLTQADLTGGTLPVRSPIDGAEIARVHETQASEMPAIIARSQAAFRAWREFPPPGVVNLSAFWAKNCVPPRPNLGRW
jgi:aldehyde dehydrogenase (NAD+)